MRAVRSFLVAGFAVAVVPGALAQNAAEPPVPQTVAPAAGSPVAAPLALPQSPAPPALPPSAAPVVVPPSAAPVVVPSPAAGVGASVPPPTPVPGAPTAPAMAGQRGAPLADATQPAPTTAPTPRMTGAGAVVVPRPSAGLADAASPSAAPGVSASGLPVAPRAADAALEGTRQPAPASERQGGAAPAAAPAAPNLTAQGLGRQTTPQSAATPPPPVDDRATTPAPYLRFAPDADVLIETEIVPSLVRLAHDTLSLQNAVIRHCLFETTVSRQAVAQNFTATIVGAAKVVPLSFGSSEASIVTDRLLTEAASTVFSRNRLAAMMDGVLDAPETLAALRQENAALMGLSALERLLLGRGYQSDEALEHRCRLSLTIVANVRVTVAAALESWRERAVAEHWAGDEEELADRLRLRDLIQGTIDAVDKFDRDVAEFARQSRNNGEVPFAQPQNGLAYLVALADGLVQQTQRLRMFTDPGGDAEEALDQIATALQAGCERLLASQEGDDASYLVAFDQAHADIIGRLPEIFDFDATAFNRAITSFEIQRPETTVETPQSQ